jgi:hypothetical protein
VRSARSTLPARTRAAILIAVLAVAVHLPGIAAPIAGDEIYSVWQAARSIREPQRLLLPWMGGAFRLIPKLVFMAGVRLWGPVAWPYKLLAVLLYAWSAVLVSRLGAKWSGSERVGAWGGALFAVGLGVYGKSVLVASNLTMLLGIVFLLLSLDALWSGRRKVALVLFVLAAASHEIVLVAPAILPFLSAARRDVDPAHEPLPPPARRTAMRRPGRVVAGLIVALMLLSILGGAVGRVASTSVTMAPFLLLPVNPAAVSDVDGGGGSALASVVGAIVQHRYWIGLGLLAALATVAWRGRAFHAVAVAWILFFLIPGSFVAAGWQGGYLEMRYQAISAVGLCLLAARLVEWADGRRRALALGVACVLIGWALAFGALWLRGHAERVSSPEWVAERQELREALAGLGFH